jgi:hypothetical protein
LIQELQEKLHMVQQEDFQHLATEMIFEELEKMKVQ